MSRSLVAAAIAVFIATPTPAAWAAEPAPLLLTAPAAPGAAGASSSIALSEAQRQLLVQHLLDEKPDPGTYAIASALLPGAGEVALGDWQEPALVWGALLLASIGVYAIKTGTFGIHPAFLASTPYVLISQVSIPLAYQVPIPSGTTMDDPNDFYNRFLDVAYLGAAAWTSYRTYQLAEQRRAEIDKVVQPLAP